MLLQTTSLADLRCFLTATAVLLLCVLEPRSASAQAAATVRGIVRDAGSGAPVAGALLAVEDHRALSSTDGTFRMTGLPTGRRRIRVEAFGYRPLEENVTVSVGMDPIELRLQPDPIQLRELTVTGNARAALSGVVLNAQSGEPIEWTDLTLTSGVTRQVGRREASNEQGVFSIANIPPGEYLLLVQRIGFTSVYVPVSHSVPPVPIEVRLEPDSVLIRGLAVMNGELELRRDGHGRVARVFKEEELRLSRAAGMRHFFEVFSPLRPVECGDPPRRNCLLYRGASVRPRIFIDGILEFDPPPPISSPMGRVPGAPPPPPPLPPMSMDVLDSYDPRDFHSVEYFECDGGRVEVYVYTYLYMVRMAGRPRIPMPACLP
jgi:hypothetical protein